MTDVPANSRRENTFDLTAAIRVLLLLVLMATTGAAQSRDTRTWYQAYRDAQTKIQQRNWQGALADLDAATRAGAPRPGRNINFYGDTFGTYNPDYYRGVALANLGRDAEADQSFERVRTSNLLDQKDPSYTEFVRLSASVKENVKQLAAKNAANTPAQTTTAQSSQSTTQVDAGGSAVATGNQPSGGLTPTQAALLTQPVNPPGTVSSSPPPGRTTGAYSPGTNVVPGTTTTGTRTPTTPGPKVSPIPLDPKALANTKAGAVIAKEPPARAAQKEERAGIFAFYSGDYAGAAQILRPLADAGAANARTYLYLASSQAALVLTGETQLLVASATGVSTPADALREAQAFAARVGSTAPYARDLALISPRIREQLGLRP